MFFLPAERLYHINSINFAVVGALLRAGAHLPMAGGRLEGFLKRGRGGGGGPSGVPQADGTVVRPKDADTVFASELSGRLPLALD